MCIISLDREEIRLVFDALFVIVTFIDTEYHDFTNVTVHHWCLSFTPPEGLRQVFGGPVNCSKAVYFVCFLLFQKHHTTLRL